MILAINRQKIDFQPVSFTIKKSNLYSDSTKRSAETGVLLLYPIRMNIYSLEIEYLCTPEQAETLENLISENNFEVEFYDSVYSENKKITKNFYSSDISKTVEGAINSRKYRINFTLVEI